ncbi:RDD family protein [Streptomyces sp. YIM 98790]|uniref:RDD family protein n=1 Tax=Streptomyces sp. YIM 98790 TaxID=2689077 RepID=UPI00140BE030|nr:RDD family protein [Streptomyces sp. YIM 98790]
MDEQTAEKPDKPTAARQAIGTWLSGPRAGAEQLGADLGHRGARLGLPAEGPGSIAAPGRRLAAIGLDWAMCTLVAYGLLAGDRTSLGNWTLLVFTVLAVVTVGTVGATPGKRLLGLRVISVQGTRLTFPRAALRSVLLALAVPALIWDRDGRGLHDRLSGAVQVRI